MGLSIQDLGIAGLQPSIDWTTNQFVNETASNTTLTKVNMISGSVGSPTTVASITGHVGDGTVNNIIVSDQNGNLYFGSGTAGNRYCPVTKATEEYALVYTTGSSSAGGPPGTDGLNDPAGLTVITANAASWIVSVGDVVLAQSSIQINRGDNGTYLVGNNHGTSTYPGPPVGNHTWFLDEVYNSFVSPGSALAGGNLATAYIVAPSPTVLGFYCAGVTATPQWLFAKIGTLVPSDIDPDWAGLNFGDIAAGLFASGVAVDRADNGMITFVAITRASGVYNGGTTYAIGDIVFDGATLNYTSLQNGNVGNTPSASPTFWRPMQMQYCIKANTGPYSVSGSGSFGVAWRVPVKTMPNNLNVMGQSSITRSIYLYVENTVPTTNDSVAWTINTKDGTYTTEAVPGVQCGAGYQSSEDPIGSIVTFVNYIATTPGAPAGLNGTTTFSGHWARLYLGLPPPPPPPFVPPPGGYIIERLDNRIWPTVENAWCVDCGFTLARPEPPASLTMDSATGAGILTGVTNLIGGSGYSSATTANVVDGNGLGPGTGAVAVLTITAGVITAIAFSPGGSGYIYPRLVFNDPENTGSGASATITLDNSCMCTASAPVFSAGDVGSVIRFGYSVSPITSFIDSTHVMVNMLSPSVFVQPDDPIPPNTQTQVAGSWTMTEPISQFYLPQLIGFEITGLADGQVIPPTIVPDNGIVTLAQPASAIIVGLGFQAQLQSTYLDAGEPTVQGQRKKIAEVTVRVEQSASFQAGGNQPDGSVQSPQQLAPLWQNMIDVPSPAVPPFNSPAQQLFTGDIRVPIPGGYNTRGQVAVQQSNPLPLQVLDYSNEILAGDKPSQEAPQRQRGKGQGQGQ